MIICQLLSTKTLKPWYTFFGRTFLLLIAFQPLAVKSHLNGIEACQNQCLNRNECEQVGDGLCCQWDNDISQCNSIIGEEICPGTATLPPSITISTSIPCPLKATILPRQTSPTTRILSGIQDNESAPTTSPTKYHETSQTSSCKNLMKKPLDWFICKGKTIEEYYEEYYEGYFIPYYKVFSIDQYVYILIIYKISAVISILGSSYVIQDVLRDSEKRKESTYHRIMFGLSCSDIIYSFSAFFLGTWVMPKGSHVFAVGSNTTCGVTGFFASTAFMSGPLYNCSLATFYLLKLKFSWLNRKIKAVERWLLFLPCTVSLIVGIYAIATSSFGANGITCTITTKILLYVFMTTMILAYLYVSIAMFLVYLAVHKVEKQAQQYTFAAYSTSRSSATMEMSRRVMLQGILYSAALVSLFIPFLLAVVIQVPPFNNSYAMEILGALTLPSQGFFNALIYMIPLFQQMIKKRCKSRQKTTSKSRSSWLDFFSFWRLNKTTQSSISVPVTNIKNECGQEEEVFNSETKGDVLTGNLSSSITIDMHSKKEKQMPHLSPFSALKDEKEDTIVQDDIMEEGNFKQARSTLLYIDEGGQSVISKPQSLVLSHQNTEPKKKGGSHQDYSSQLALHVELGTDSSLKVFDMIDDEDDDNNESYTDDYLKMMEN